VVTWSSALAVGRTLATVELAVTAAVTLLA
jgi:hypothetical protein